MKSPIDTLTLLILLGFILLASSLLAGMWFARARRLRDVRNAVINAAMSWKWTLVWTKAGDYPAASISGIVDPYPFTATLSWQRAGSSQRALFTVAIAQPVANAFILSIESPHADRTYAIPGSSPATAHIVTNDALFDASFRASVNVPGADQGLLRQDVRSEILRMWNPRLLLDPNGLTLHVWLPTSEPSEVSATIERTVFFLVKLAGKRATLPPVAPG